MRGVRRAARFLAGLTAWVVLAALGPGLAMAGSISGTVTDATSHDPLAGIEVCAYPIAAGGSICEATNAAGEYAIGGLASDQYRVGFRGQAQGYVTQYFDHEMRWVDSDPVTVSSGTVAGIDA
ncbi:MAG TPA: carboxypeptidase-like regulatory domain-containing protein, partial [Solirubrobacterales bacterium]|nr:carboxypeptidase-like regulatory domain-containing protein [Solirubrobacterales bacterium]